MNRKRVERIWRREGLEDENAKLKKLLAEAMLDIAVLKDITGNEW